MKIYSVWERYMSQGKEMREGINFQMAKKEKKLNGAEIYKKSVPNGRNCEEESFCLDNRELIWWDRRQVSAKLRMNLERGRKRRQK